MASTHEILGRDEVDDLEAILAVTNTDVNEVEHLVKSNGDAIFTWDYDRSRPALGKLYERAKKSQWNAQTDLPWDTDVDQEHVVLANALQNNVTFGSELDTKGTPFEKWGDAEWLAFGVQSQNWTLSQFLHGEQGALICTAKVVETVPWIDAKYYAATQVMDEARHVEVFAKYLDEKLSGHYPINAHLKLLLDDLPRHADHGRGPRARRLRVHPADDDRAAPEEAPALRDGRRSSPRRVRCALAPGVLQGAERARDP
jgi:hypothetical protein